ncbi:hypothetical protein [uncultured Amphritea sp.]|uniref:nucleoside-diphosphate sugar epimerase/dehydratase n=1 Tax=uncultured Amphritea sp. TaxID=981605 RepID=UPI00262D9C6E|nr:hypothetical protein [uncultured Amphritea sp.]
MFSWIARFRKADIKKLIIIGIGYSSHNLSKALLATGGYQIIAYIDEEPWNHLNQMNGAKLYYPSELLALAEKHRVDGVLKFEGEGWQPDNQSLVALKKLSAVYIDLDGSLKTDEQVRMVNQCLLF